MYMCIGDASCFWVCVYRIVYTHAEVVGYRSIPCGLGTAQKILQGGQGIGFWGGGHPDFAICSNIARGGHAYLAKRSEAIEHILRGY